MYRVGTFMFGKRHSILQSFFTCGASALAAPPPGILSGIMPQYRIHPQKTEKVETFIGLRNGYMMCNIIHALNQAQVTFKRRYCRPGEVYGGIERLSDLRPERIREAQEEMAKNGRRLR